MCQPQGELRLPYGFEPVESDAEVVVLGLEPIEPLLGRGHVRLELLCDGEEVPSVGAVELLSLARLRQALARVLADRLEHPVAGRIGGLAFAQEALVEERLQGVGVGVCDLLGGLVGAAAGKDREAAEEPLLLFGEEVVRPFDRRPQRLLAGISVSIALEQVEALREPLEQLLAREDRGARGGELDRERKLVEAGAELVDCRGGGEGGLDGAGASAEERPPVLFCERRHRPGLLAADPQPLAARHEQGRPVGGAQCCDRCGGLRQQVLEVVEHEQQALARQVRAERVLERAIGLFLDRERLRERRENE